MLPLWQLQKHPSTTIPSISVVPWSIYYTIHDTTKRVSPNNTHHQCALIKNIARDYRLGCLETTPFCLLITNLIAFRFEEMVNPLSNPKGVKLYCELCQKPAYHQCTNCRAAYYWCVYCENNVLQYYFLLFVVTMSISNMIQRLFTICCVIFLHKQESLYLMPTVVKRDFK